MTQDVDTTVRRTITVAASQQRAFEVFTAQLGSGGTSLAGSPYMRNGCGAALQIAGVTTMSSYSHTSERSRDHGTCPIAKARA